MRSEAAFRATGCWGVAEGAALAAVGPSGSTDRAAAPVAPCDLRRRARPAPIDAADDRPAARPAGDHRHRSRRPGLAHPGGERAARRRDDVVGYRLYLDLLGRGDRRQTPPRQRDRRGRRAGAAGARPRRRRAVGGAGLVGRCRHLRPRGAGLRADRPRSGGATGRRSRSPCAPGISAMQAAAARAGAPLGHDFCAISLSDLLTPWPAIRARLEAAAARRFRRRAVQPALGTPRRAARRGRRRSCSPIARPTRPVVIARNLGRGRRRRSASCGSTELAGDCRGRHAEPRPGRQQPDAAHRRRSAAALHAARLFRPTQPR